jgi:glucan phosphoethanolaminetransferase (alkaline phosphatase superfamily)
MIIIADACESDYDLLWCMFWCLWFGGFLKMAISQIIQVMDEHCSIDTHGFYDVIWLLLIYIYIYISMIIMIKLCILLSWLLLQYYVYNHYIFTVIYNDVVIGAMCDDQQLEYFEWPITWGMVTIGIDTPIMFGVLGICHCLECH